MKQGGADTNDVQKPVWLITQEMSNHEQQKTKHYFTNQRISTSRSSTSNQTVKIFNDTTTMYVTRVNTITKKRDDLFLN